MFKDEIRKIGFLIGKLIHERRLSRNEWNFLLTVFFTMYALGALALGLLIVRAESFRELGIALITFCPIFFALFLLHSFRAFLVQESRWRTAGAVGLISFGFVMFAVAGVGYVDFVNAITSSRYVHLAAGEIRQIEPRRRDAPRVFLFDGRSTAENIPISDKEYARIHLGDYYVSNMRLGGLGLYYRWRFDSWNRGWERRVAARKGE